MKLKFNLIHPLNTTVELLPKIRLITKIVPKTVSTNWIHVLVTKTKLEQKIDKIIDQTKLKLRRNHLHNTIA